MDTRFHNIITLEIDDVQLTGEAVLPLNTTSLVLFSHGSGSSRLSPRNNFVAKELQKQNIGTFLFDLLTKQEDEEYANRFNIDLLTERLIKVTTHIASRKNFSDLSMGYFGASTGAASALKAAALFPEMIRAIVSRGGRPDLAIPEIQKVQAPTLFIVGERDYEVINLNKKAYALLQCPKKLEIVPSATHLFEEPGTLYQASQLAANWFEKYLTTLPK